MNTEVLFWSAIAATGLSFFGFAALFVSVLKEGTGAYAQTMGEETSRAFEDVFLFVSPKKIADLGLFAALGAFFLFFIPLLSFTDAVSTVCGVALGLAAGLFVFTLPKRLVGFLRVRRRLRFETQLVEQLSAMANALRAGFSINQTFEGVVKTGENPIAQEFAVLLQQLRVGMSFDDALASLDRRMGSEDLTLVCTSIDIARRTGGNLTEIFDKISETIRARMRIQRRVRTLTAQGRFQGVIVSVMPVALGVILTAMKPDLMLPFLRSGVGLACVAVMFALVIGGWLVIRRIIRIDV